MSIRKPVIMVSSSVYQIRPLLDQIYSALTQMGYTVWMSHKGTLPTDPALDNRDNCLQAVEDCELFLGLITPFYGSGIINAPYSITHEEQMKAIADDKLRWFLVHSNVEFARQALKQYRFKKNGSPKAGFRFKKTAVMDNHRVIDMCEEVRQSTTGNWVQEYMIDQQALEFINGQFGDLKRIRTIMRRSTP